VTDIRYSSRYQGLLAESYDAEQAWLDDLEFYATLAKNCCGPVLELGCGTGRLLIPLAERGIRITGLDNSKAMLRVCESKLKDAPDYVRDLVTLVQADMCRFHLGSVFGMVFISCNTFLHLTDESSARAALKAARDHLAEDGIFVIHNLIPDLDEMRASDGTTTIYEHYHPTRDTVLRTSFTATYDLDRCVEHDVMVVEELDGDTVLRKATSEHDITYYSPSRLRALMESCGLRAHAEYGSVGSDPLTSDSTEAIFVCKRITP
jgi:SAM-dependent methyltransferase